MDWAEWKRWSTTLSLIVAVFIPKHLLLIWMCIYKYINFSSVKWMRWSFAFILFVHLIKINSDVALKSRSEGPVNATRNAWYSLQTFWRLRPPSIVYQIPSYYHECTFEYRKIKKKIHGEEFWSVCSMFLCSGGRVKWFPRSELQLYFKGGSSQAKSDTHDLRIVFSPLKTKNCSTAYGLYETKVFFFFSLIKARSERKVENLRSRPPRVRKIQNVYKRLDSRPERTKKKRQKEFLKGCDNTSHDCRPESQQRSSVPCYPHVCLWGWGGGLGGERGRGGVSILWVNLYGRAVMMMQPFRSASGLDFWRKREARKGTWKGGWLLDFRSFPSLQKCRPVDFLKRLFERAGWPKEKLKEAKAGWLVDRKSVV